MLGLGYNTALVTLGAGLLGLSAGVTGTFLYLRKRALVADAISHATLPGVALAFLAMVALGLDGRNLAGLLAGSALSAWVGLLAVTWLARRTRLSEDAAIGAVLSVFFGFGVVLLTVIQTMQAGRQAGLDSLLLGSTAGMLRSDALLIAAGGALTLAAVWVLRRPLEMVAFDAGHARTIGLDVGRTDLALMVLVLAVTVVGLKVVGLVLIVALLIIPGVAARFWTERAGRMALIAGVIGAGAGMAGALVSASAPGLPTGPVIVLCCFVLFLVSLICAPARGAAAAMLRQRRVRARLLQRQGLLALAEGRVPGDAATRRALARAGYLEADGRPTPDGRAAMAGIARDEARWRALRGLSGHEAVSARYDGLTPLETYLDAGELALLDRGAV